MIAPKTRPDEPPCIAGARALGDTIRAHAEAIECDRRLPDALMDRLHEARLARMLLPRSAGGDEIAPSVYLDTLIELARHDGSVGWNIFVANSAALLAAFLPLDAAREIYARPDALMAWGPPNSQQARAAEGGYRVGGEWSFASGCRHATWMGAHCQVLEPDGSLRRNSAGRPVIRSLLFPAGQAQLLDDWNPIGLRGTGSESYRVEDVFVPERFSATREEPDKRREPGPLYAFTQQSLYAVGVAGVALGLADAMLDAFMELARGKTPRGLARHAENPGVQAEVSRSFARLGSARAWLVETVDEVYDGARDIACIDVPTRARVRLACSHAIQGAVETAAALYRLAGVDAIFPGSAFERRFRDIHTLSQQIQSRPQHFEATGHVLLGGAPEVFY